MLLVARPAQAASFSWNDPEGDAVVAVEPSEPTLDLVKATVSSDGSKIEWVAQLKTTAADQPPMSAGYFFVFEFTFGDATYDLRVREDVSAKTVTLRPAKTGAQDLPCKGCEYVLDRKAHRVTVKTPLASLAESIKVHDPEAPKFGAGSTIEAPLVNSYRSYIGISLLADDAPSPEGTSFKL